MGYHLCLQANQSSTPSTSSQPPTSTSQQTRYSTSSSTSPSGGVTSSATGAATSTGASAKPASSRSHVCHMTQLDSHLLGNNYRTSSFYVYTVGLFSRILSFSF